MTKMIRWPGLIAFVVLMALIVGGAYFFAAPLIERGIEKAGTAMAGARVDVGRVRLGLQPFAITIFNMEVADEEHPMQNLFEFDRAIANINLLRLLMGQTIIDNLELHGLRFDTPRKTSGAIPKKPKPKSAEPSFFEQQLQGVKEELPEPDEIMAREPLLIDQRKKEWDAVFAEKKQAWETLKAKLPSAEKLKGYELELKTVTEGKITSLQDFNERSERLKQLKEAIKADRATLKQASEEIKASKEALQISLTNLKNAPREDWERIRAKYRLDEGGMVNIAYLLFGDKFSSYTRQGLYWYHKAEPYISTPAREAAEKEQEKPRLTGRFVRFPEQNPLPDFLIRKSAISAIVERGVISITVLDITHQQNIINRPTRLQIRSTALKGIRQLEVDGVFDHRTAIGSDTLKLVLAEMAMDELKISKEAGFPLTLASAQATLTGSATLSDGKLAGAFNSQFNQAVFAGEADSTFANEVLLAIKSIDTFNIDATFSGSLKDIDFAISSDLDNRLKEAFKDRLDVKKQELKEKLNQKLQERLAKYLGDETKLDIFAGSEGIEQQIGQLEKMLEQKLADYKDEQKSQLEKKAKDKLLKKLF